MKVSLATVAHNLLLAVLVVIVIAAMIGTLMFYLDCSTHGGILVRGLLWFECLPSR